ncbi:MULTISPECIES: hypothetical protein [unclassified Burkholderia]|uniref:hypothetical protein n=1 Tax=unclassified Burkholderia TaxID=2613784 RepID=UPI000752CDCA|nr:MULTISPECIES: hypothetical protein [unclassified Burkholderia]KVN10717.1 hypothetical protein WT08_14900 [Burkholderia sp. MSMB1552]KWZ50536.1 hypothetical protein WS92_24470 [Burkholderia sp. MSMB1588]
MSEPANFLAFLPAGKGLMCATTMAVVDEDVYGWYTGPSARGLVAAFFMLEHYYSTHETAFYHSVDDDARGPWVLAWPSVEIDAGRLPPVSDAMCAELERMQDAFAAEWLFYCDDPAAAAEAAWYRTQGLPLEGAGIRHARLNRLDRGGTLWTYASPSLDLNIVDCLRQRWPLDYALAP